MVVNVLIVCHSSWISVVIGNVSKVRVCLSLAKNFCADADKLAKIEEQIHEIEANPAIVTVQGKPFTLRRAKVSRWKVSRRQVDRCFIKGFWFLFWHRTEFKWRWTWAASTRVTENRYSLNGGVGKLCSCWGVTVNGRNDCGRKTDCIAFITQVFRIALFSLLATVNIISQNFRWRRKKYLQLTSKIHLRSIETAYGCSQCAGIAFCSTTCQKEAATTYHRFDCKFMDMMIGSGMSILCFIALRLIVQESTVDVAIERGRRILHELCSHSKQRPADDYLQRTIMSAFLLRILQKSGFFGQRTSDSREWKTNFQFPPKLWLVNSIKFR